jgi:putative ABC transport system permease protein
VNKTMPLFLRNVWTDARFALRLLLRAPAFAATVLGVLVLGIGATTAMFSLVVALFVRPLPYPHPEELTVVTTWHPGVDPSSVSVPDFIDWKVKATTFDSLAAVSYEAYGLSSEGEAPESLDGAQVTGDFFSVYRVVPLLGRLFGPDDDRIGQPRIAVISAALWHRRFASDPHVVGRTVVLSGESFTVVGVAAEGFRFATPDTGQTDVWTPIAVARREYAKDSSADRRGSRFMKTVGRMKPGVTLVQANAEMTAIASELATRFPDTNATIHVRVKSLHEELVGSSRGGVWVLFGAVALVFLVMCANVANLLLARASSRRAEMAVRAALGATRGRLAAQLMTESVVLFVIAACLGTILAHWLVRFFATGLVDGMASLQIPAQVDGTALGFALGLSAVCGFVFGIVPAGEASRLDPHAVLKDTAARMSMGRAQRAVRGGLVVVQVALALALLAGSGLALRAFVALASTPMGFEADGLATAKISVPEAKYDSPEKIRAFLDAALARFAAQPGVVSVSANSQLPLGGSNSNSSFAVEGRTPWQRAEEPTVEQNIISPNYFKTMGIPLLRGRDFTAADVDGSRLVTIISKRFAERIFPGEDPIGKRIAWGTTTPDDDTTWLEIVGVVGDVRRRGLATPIALEGYAPAAQIPVRWIDIVARSDQPSRLMREMPRLVASVDPEQAITASHLMSDRVARSIGSQRFATKLLGAFALAALLLATLGIFGLVSYTTTQRTRELGIRMALGSTPEGVVAVVMREGMILLSAGLLTGLVGAIFVGRAIAGRMNGAVSFDLSVFLVIFGILGLAGTLASLFPALRAVRIPPSVSLRYE